MSIGPVFSYYYISYKAQGQHAIIMEFTVAANSSAGKYNRDMIHLRAVAIRPFKEIRFPFNLTILQNLTELNFNTPVTFLVGENGMGKSTFLEAIACAAEMVTTGSKNVKTDKYAGIPA